MTFFYSRWIQSVKEDGDKRFDILTANVGPSELIEYRNSLRKTDAVLGKVQLFFAALGFIATLVICMLEELSLITSEDCALMFGYTFGYGAAIVILIPKSTKTIRRLTAEIERQLIAEKEMTCAEE